MNQSCKKLIIIPLFCAFFSINTFASKLAETHNIEQKNESYSVGLGATRIIYNSSSLGAVVSVENPNTYPVLVKSKVYLEDKKTAAPFVVTPPLFLLEGQEQSRIRIVRKGNSPVTDKETLNWLCVEGIPPEADDVWAQGSQSAAARVATLNVVMKVNRCVKLLDRPETIKTTPDDLAGSLEWKQVGNKLKVQNPSPFYMTLGTLKVNGKEIKDVNYIPPFSSKEFSLSINKVTNIDWTIIGDLGGESRIYSTTI